MNNLSGLDIISVMSYILQIQNSDEDKRYKSNILEFEDKIQKEVDELHRENDVIMNKLDMILENFRE